MAVTLLTSVSVVIQEFFNMSQQKLCSTRINRLRNHITRATTALWPAWLNGDRKRMAEGSQSSTSSKESKSNEMGFGMKTTIKAIRVKYSKVKDITTETLHGWLDAQKEDKSVVLMDCRDECEYMVSHLAGAQRVDWEKGDPHQLLEPIPADKPSTVVCYCSVGYRSAALADRIGKYLHSLEKGKTQGTPGNIQVFNLEGSIFKWANEGRPMIDSIGQPTTRCHPYSAVWGKLLNKDLRCTDTSSSL